MTDCSFILFILRSEIIPHFALNLEIQMQWCLLFPRIRGRFPWNRVTFPSFPFAITQALWVLSMPHLQTVWVAAETKPSVLHYRGPPFSFISGHCSQTPTILHRAPKDGSQEEKEREKERRGWGDVWKKSGRRLWRGPKLAVILTTWWLPWPFPPNSMLQCGTTPHFVLGTYKDSWVSRSEQITFKLPSWCRKFC